MLLVPLALALALLASGSTPALAGGGGAPELNLQDGLNGITASTTLASLKGSPVVLLFWLPICPHCPPAAARAETLRRTYASRGLRVISVTHGRKSYVAQYMRDHGYKYGVGFDWQAITHARYGVGMLPAMILIGKDGSRIQYGSSIEAAIERQLGS